MSATLPCGRWTLAEYAARVGLPSRSIRRLISVGLPTERDWSQRPAGLMIPAKRADAWLAENGVDFIRHPRPAVYFVLNQNSGRLKIGFSDNFDRRVREHRTEATQAGDHLILLGALPGGRELEREWIGLAEECECHLGGEWCFLDPEFAAELEVAIDDDCAARAA